MNICQASGQRSVQGRPFGSQGQCISAAAHGNPTAPVQVSLWKLLLLFTCPVTSWWLEYILTPLKMRVMFYFPFLLFSQTNLWLPFPRGRREKISLHTSLQTFTWLWCCRLPDAGQENHVNQADKKTKCLISSYPLLPFLLLQLVSSGGDQTSRDLRDWLLCMISLHRDNSRSAGLPFQSKMQ